MLATACSNDKRIDFLCTLKEANGPKMAHNADLLELNQANTSNLNRLQLNSSTKEIWVIFKDELRGCEFSLLTP